MIQKIEHLGTSQNTVFLCENETDKDTITESNFGDEVIVLVSNKKYIKDSSNIWKKV